MLETSVVDIVYDATLDAYWGVVVFVLSGTRTTPSRSVKFRVNVQKRSLEPSMSIPAALVRAASDRLIVEEGRGAV